MKKYFLFLLLTVICCAWLSAQTQYSFTRYTQQDGLNSGFIQGITEDRNGFIWLSSEEGMTRFDGYTFKSYGHDPTDTNSLSDKSINELELDDHGNLMCRSENALSRYDLVHDRFTSVMRYEGKIRYKSIKTGLNHEIWILTENELIRVVNEREGHTTYPLPQGYHVLDGSSKIELMKDGSVFLISHNWALLYDPKLQSIIPLELKSNEFMHTRFDGKNKVIIQHGTDVYLYCQAGLFKLDKRQSAFILVAENQHFLSGEGMTAGVFTCDSSLYIITQPGSLFRVDLGNGKENLVELHLQGNKERLKIEHFNWATPDEKGNVWIGTNGDGLYKFDTHTNTAEHFVYEKNNPNSLSSDAVSKMFIDKSGVLWMNCKGLGLVKMESMNHSFITCIPMDSSNLSAGLVQNNVRALISLNDSTILAGTLGGLYSFHQKNLKFSPFIPWKSASPLLEKSTIGALVKDAKGRIWIGHWNDPIITICDPNEKKTIEYALPNSDPDGNLCRVVRALCTDKNDNIWIATICGIFMIRPEDVNFSHPELMRIKPYFYSAADPNSISGFQVFTIYADKQNRIIAGTQSGLTILDQHTGKITRYTHDKKNPKSISSDNVRSILQDHLGTIWAGTNEGGLNKFDEEKKSFKVYTTHLGLPDNAIYAMQEDDRGYLWLSTQKGLCRFDPKNGNCKNFTLKDGLQNLEFNTNASMKTSDGMMAFGGVSGFNIFIPDFIEETSSVFPVTITKVKVFENEIPVVMEGIELSSKENHLSFEYTSISHYRNQEHQYAYKLDGVDENWVIAGNRRYASYTNLAPGHYTFYVKTTDNNTDEKSTALKIFIHLPWYRTPFALSLFVLLFISLIYLTYRFYANRLLSKERENARIREAELKTLALTEKNKRNEEALANAKELEKAYLELQHTQAQLIQKEKLASLGQLTAGVAHEINNPINFVYSSVPSLNRNFEDIKKLISEYASLDLSPEQKRKMDEFRKMLDIDFTITESDTLLRGISEGAKRTAEIVKELRNFSRTDDTEMHPADLKEGITSTLLLLSKKIEDKSIHIETKFGEIPQIYCFQGQLNQMWMNLISNAIDAVDPKGSIIIETKLSENKKEALVSVKDNGHGMTDEVKSKIFDPFYTTKEIGKGTGLGLSISYGIVEKHKGKVTVNTAPGSGTEFIISLPLQSK